MIDAVYAHQDGRTYVALFDGDHGEQRWWRWPAEEHGWAQRRACSADEVDPDREYEPRLAWLALRLSGVPGDA